MNYAYTRQMGVSNLQHEQLVLSSVRQDGAIQRAEVIELCRLSEGQAKDLLKRMKMNGKRQASLAITHNFSC